MSNAVKDVGERLMAFLPNLRRFAISLCGSRDVADDLVQSACERALASAERFEPGTRFDAWIFRILRNLWIDQVRRQKTAGVQDDITERHDIAGSSGERETEARLTSRPSRRRSPNCRTSSGRWFFWSASRSYPIAKRPM